MDRRFSVTEMIQLPRNTPFRLFAHSCNYVVQSILATFLQGFRDGLRALFVSSEVQQTCYQMIQRHLLMGRGTMLEDF